MKSSQNPKEFKENQAIESSEIMTLYHGSKSGICGAIAPLSRKHCDFGKGFYMGTEKSQPLTLICNYPHAVLYTLNVDLSGLKILDMEVGLDWALLIAFHRGKMESAKNSTIYDKFSNLSRNYDIIAGYIANDRMFMVLDRFFYGEISDLALINSLSALRLGKQYVALTEKACKKIRIVDSHKISEFDREKLKSESMLNRSKGIAMANEICRKYRREGRFFDEILKDGE